MDKQIEKFIRRGTSRLIGCNKIVCKPIEKTEHVYILPVLSDVARAILANNLNKR